MSAVRRRSASRADRKLAPLPGGLGRTTVFGRAGSEPDRQSIVWEEIYLRYPGGAERQVTDDKRADLAPQRLRDGRVAFTSCIFAEGDVPPDCSLVALNPATLERETLLEALGVVFDGELSPDERTFLFTRLDEVECSDRVVRAGAGRR